MTDKSPVDPNICSSDQPVSAPVDVIWSSDFHDEGCLPVIGSCQVSSILSTLENVEQKNNAPEKNDSNDNVDSFKSIPINIINSDSVPSVDEVKKRIKNHENLVVLDKKQLFQEMIYFGCNLCPFICTKDSKITDHIKSVHKNKNNNNKPQLKCPGCENIFYHKLSLRSHLIHDHEVSRNDINKIVNSIVYVSVLTTNNNTTETNESSAVEKQKKDESEYVSEDLQIQNIEQEICFSENYLPKQETNENFEMKQMKKPEEQKRSQKCCVSTCAVRMNDLENMSYHIKTHFGKIFRCLECNENFVIWKSLQTHLWRVHNKDMELFSCDKCNYKTYSLAKLNNTHKLIHGNEKPFLCDLCGKGFKNPKQLRNHKIIHKSKPAEKMQQCHICERIFSDRRLLKVHIDAVHEKIKPFSCSFCGYKAASNGALKLHIRTHTGQKPFSCDSCDYSTADHNSLRRHKLRHSGEKKYKCAHCEYSCIQSSTYKTHLKTKHPGLENNLMFSCDFCQFRSVNKDKYLIHVASHKNNKQTQISDSAPEENFQVINLKNKKDLEMQNMEIKLQETPVALISKINDASQNNHCIILSAQNDNILNLTNSANDTVLPNSTSTSSIQYFYSGQNVLLEIIDEKSE